MKRLPALYSALVLIGPLLVVAALMSGPFGCGGGGAGPTPTPTQGSLEVGLVDSPSNGFQAITLNVVSVRLNPSTDVNVPDTDPNWVTVSAPPGAGPGELSVNLLDFQNNATVFNTGPVTAQTYYQIEVVADPNLPGTVMPSCTSGTQEGCVTANATFKGSTNLRTTAAGGFVVAPLTLTPLIIDINPMTPIPPSSPGGNYTLNPSISVASSGTYLVPVSGAVVGVTSTSVDSINAELTGTNGVVATAPVSSTGSYLLQLPAAAVNGTTYDLFVSGSTTYAVLPSLTVTRGSSPTENFAVATVASGAIGGTIIDGRTGGALVGATVNLLLPAKSSDNCSTSLTGCVVVNTTTSDSSGNYIFAVPAPPTGTPYYVQGSMTGTTTTTLEVTGFGTTVSTCTGSPDSSNCSISLPNALLSGTVVVDPPPAAGTNTVVTVMAEPTGAGSLVGLTQVVVPPSGTASFSMEVPTGGNVDLIASAEDSYLGIGTPYSGHQLAVASDVTPAGTTPVVTLTVTCLGHGTIAGVANSADAATSVELFQMAESGALVQLMDSTVGLTLYPNQYSFCAPPNTYQVQRFELPGPLETPKPVGTLQQVVVPTPAPIPSTTPTPGPVASPTPCPLCENTDGQCPGNCSATSANPLLP